MVNVHEQLHNAFLRGRLFVSIYPTIVVDLCDICMNSKK